MYCKNCGANLNEDAKFCKECGNSTNLSASRENIIEDNEIVYKLKPKFNIPYKLCTITFSAIAIILLVLLSLEEMFFELVDLVPNWYIYVLGILTIVVLIKMLFEKKQYDRLEYDFYNTKVEYIDGFLNKEQKELKYKSIREISMHQNILERLFNIGTIKIHTNASSGYYANSSRHGNMEGKNGINIHCVENVKEEYKKIREIFDKSEE